MFKIKNIVTISDYITIINIILGMFAILFHDFRFIYGAIVFDALDGYIARKTNTVSDFGAQLDSLCDVVSFGVAPAYLLYFYFENISTLIASLIFLVCGALRLARFGVLNVKYFVGLPIPAGALVLSVFCQLFLRYSKDLGSIVSMDINNLAISLLAVLVGLIMISDIKYPKYPNKIALMLFGISLLLSLVGIFEVLFICVIGYLLYGILKMDMEGS
ncbi:MAG TPA: CDP-diacylglycerol--serine O-phosphatidyltransferase [Methanothermococcus okinawensis]|uniref:CDP-diacylglycerol--serine O-phosphatidyltransferase n=1 Tax=Methanothermococcus okinawensis TaxID=155863 RepID=A0A832YU55_9EURY|nr:CDP-diacylglycerol--serine O-phosphatidyltransferase [Methanothermococcus okinawensis]